MQRHTPVPIPLPAEMQRPTTSALAVIAEDAPVNAPHGAVNASDGRAPRWLALAASDLRTALSWRWLVYLVASLLRLRFRVGTTAVLAPVRTGGGDHSLRASMTGRSPMVFGGAYHCAERCVPRAVYLGAASVVARPLYTEVSGRSGTTHLVPGGWIATRRANRRRMTFGQATPGAGESSASWSMRHVRSTGSR